MLSRLYRTRSIFLILLFVAFSALELHSYAYVQSDFFGLEDIRDDLKAQNTIREPLIHNGKLVLFYKPDHYARYAGVAFAHEGFSKVHLFSKNDKGIFFVAYPIPAETVLLEYRIVVDGAWYFDSANPDYYINDRGYTISRIQLSEPIEVSRVTPYIQENGYVKFVYRGETGKRVYLNCEALSWDPFPYRMRETKVGYYEITVRIPSGKHLYYFLVNGQKRLDSTNSAILKHNIEGNVNLFQMY